MGEDSIKAAARQVRSTIKKAVSRITGDAKTGAEGTAGEIANEAEITRKRAIRDTAKE